MRVLVLCIIRIFIVFCINTYYVLSDPGPCDPVHFVDTKCKITRDSGNAVRCTCTRSAADLTAFNGRPGLRPTRCQRALVRVIAAAQVLYANRISTYDNGSCGVRALAELILRQSWSTVATGSELVRGRNRGAQQVRVAQTAVGVYDPCRQSHENDG